MTHNRRSARGSRTNRGPRARVVVGLLVMLLTIAGAVTVVACSSQSPVSSSGSAVRDMNGAPVHLDAQPAPAAESKVAAPAAGLTLKVPSVGLDVPVASLLSVDGEITPPGFTSAYWVRDRGIAPDDAQAGTLYVVTHSLRNGGKAPGNYLTDVQNGRSAVSDGATIGVGKNTYTVTSSELVTKTKLAQDSGVWTNVPGRLILITCLERPDNGPSIDNLVITATLSH